MEKKSGTQILKTSLSILSVSKTTCTVPDTFTRFLNLKAIPDLPCGEQFLHSQNLYFVSIIQTGNFHVISIPILWTIAVVHVLPLCSEYVDLFCVVTKYIYYRCFQKYHNNCLLKYKNSIEIRSLRKNYIIKISATTCFRKIT